MGDDLVLDVDRLIKPATVESMQVAEEPGSSGESSCVHDEAPTSSSSSSSAPPMHSGDDKKMVIDGMTEEEELLIQSAECRICQEEDHVNNLEVPCACSGSLKFAHRKCVQRWCNEKGDITCEICHQGVDDNSDRPSTREWSETSAPSISVQLTYDVHDIQSYKPGYTAPPPRVPSDDTAIDISGGWTISGTPLDLHDPRLLAMAAAERHFLEAEYDDYAATNASGAAFCRSAALILMALLLLRHALAITNGDRKDDASAFFSLFLLRAAGFLLPCYIMAWAISILQRRRQRQEAAALAAAEVAFVLQSGQRRGLQFTIAPGPTATPHQEPLQ